MCASERFPEAIPLRQISSRIKALPKCVTQVDMPKETQSNQGSNVASGIFQQVLHQLGIKHVLAVADHPQSEDALERYHQTFKIMTKAYCFDSKNIGMKQYTCCCLLLDKLYRNL